MDVEVFRKIAILSGTDYNTHSNTSLRETMKWYESFVRENPWRRGFVKQTLHAMTMFDHPYVTGLDSCAAVVLCAFANKGTNTC